MRFDFWRKGFWQSQQKGLVHSSTQIGGGFQVLDKGDLVDKGYKQNPTVFSVIEKRASKAAQGDIIATRNGKEVENHPLVKLLENPNPTQGRKAFLKCAFTNYDISGEVFFYLVKPDKGMNAGKPKHIWVIPRQKLKKIIYLENSEGGSTPIPLTYVFDDGQGGERRIDASNIIHWKDDDPMDARHGMSKLESLRYVVSQSNAAYEGALRQIQNGGPKGILSLKSEVQGGFTAEQAGQLEAKMGPKYYGEANLNKIVVSGQQWEYTQIGLSPVDLQLMESQDISKVDISNVFNVPLPVISPQGQTYNNITEANKDFARICISFARELLGEFEKKLAPMFKMGDVRLSIDESDYHELATDIGNLVNALKTADWMTPNEKRVAQGLAPMDDKLMDEIYISTSVMPISFDEPESNSGEVRASEE